jgi:hypothetical protein
MTAHYPNVTRASDTDWKLSDSGEGPNGEPALEQTEYRDTNSEITASLKGAVILRAIGNP